MTQNLQQQAEQLRQAGRYGDTELVHLNPEEKALIDAVFGAPTKNPETGLDEHFLGGIVEGVLADKQARSARRAEWKRINRAIGIYDSSLERILGDGNAYDQVIDIYSVQRPEEIRRGFERARSELSQTAMASRTAAFDREHQQFARAEQDLTSRGLGNTTVRTNLRRGINADTQRSLQDIDSNLAGQLSQLDIGQSQALAQNFSGLGSALLGKEQAISGLEQDKANAHLGYSPTYNNALGEGIGSSLDSLLGGGIGIGVSG